MKILVVLPAYNAEKTLEKTYRDIPRSFVDDVLLVDDASHDDTVAVAKRLGIKIIVHPENRGYGGNQKTCYEYALRNDADIIVMLHPDYQYDPTLIPDLVAPICRQEADIVLGSRMQGRAALKGGMPLYKYLSNRLLTLVENYAFGLSLSEYHTGFRAYCRRILETLPFQRNSNGFLFDTEIIVQAIYAGFRFAEIPVPTRYQEDSSSVGFWDALDYGRGTLVAVLKFVLQKKGLAEFDLFRGIEPKKR
jgi:glycosyltransferase involved in cell wall biosynthesis